MEVPFGEGGRGRGVSPASVRFRLQVLRFKASGFMGSREFGGVPDWGPIFVGLHFGVPLYRKLPFRVGGFWGFIGLTGLRVRSHYLLKDPPKIEKIMIPLLPFGAECVFFLFFGEFLSNSF